jgi:hypothetical protein
LRLLAQVRRVDPDPSVAFGSARHFGLPAPSSNIELRVGAPNVSHDLFPPTGRSITGPNEAISYEGPGGTDP